MDFAILVYTNEPCRICGKIIIREEITTGHDLVFAGYSKNHQSRAAHEKCWNAGTPKAEWAYPEDAS